MVRLAMVAALALWAAPAMAAESTPAQTSRVTATLVSDTDAVAPGQPFKLGLRLRIAPGWHTYWLNPGDAGTPADLAITGAKAGDIEWPTPERIPEGPLMAYGYKTEVLLPVTATADTPGRIEATATWLVCEKICVPEEGRFTLDLPAGTPAPSAQAPLFAATKARVPRPSPFEARIAPDGALTVRGAGLGADTVRDAWFFPAAWGAVEHAAPQALAVGDGAVTLRLKPGSAFPAGPLEGTLVLRDKGGQDSFLQVAASPGPAAPAEALPVWRMVLLALAGGLILNLMPCVFPVLAMKAVAVSRMSAQSRGAVRTGALAYTAGVLVAFVGLAAALLAARAAGSAAGWGFQLQSPVVVAALAWVMVAVGLNLSGVYGVATRLAGAGQGLAMREGHAGSFFTGLLAVLVATPCTAPFMGTAIAAALLAPVAVTLLVFAAMGLGLAAPYALLAFAPGLARRLPKPGPWMDVLRGVLAFPMYAAAAWLLWVLSLQAGPDGVLYALIGTVLVGFAAWALGLAQRGAGRTSRRAGHVAAAVAVAGALLLLPSLSATSAAPAARVAEGTEPYSAARLAALRAEGRPVFVNMTAAWCVTCLVNERVALAPDAVRRAFADRNVAYLKGDWTRGDPEITAFLRSHARDGVPLYVFYPPSQPAEVLPQILTEGAVLERLNRTQGG